MKRLIRSLSENDLSVIADAFAAIGWNKPREQYERYLTEQNEGHRLVLVAEIDDAFAGYGTVVWESGYEPFRAAGIPEIVDINVLPQFRGRRVASSLMDAAEAAIIARAREAGSSRAVIAGIGVGMYPDYGAAQRMYVRRGYLPDGRGLCYDGRQLPPMARTRNDDSLNLYLTRTLTPVVE